MVEGTCRKVTVVAFSALLVAMFALGGCGSSQPASSTASTTGSSAAEAAGSSSSAAGEAAESDLVIGEESADAAVVLLENETGSSIGSLAVSPAGSDADAVALMKSGQVWAAGETAAVNIEPLGSGVYDLSVGIGGEVYVLHGFDADLVSSAAIHLEGGVAYVTYEQFGNEVSTRADEVALAEAAAAEAAEAEAAAAAEAEAQAAAESAVEETYTYDEAPATSQPAQSGDSCVDGGVVLR